MAGQIDVHVSNANEDFILGLIDGLELAGFGKESKGTVDLGIVNKLVVGRRKEGRSLPGPVE